MAGLATRAFCASKGAYPSKALDPNTPGDAARVAAEALRTAAIGYVGGAGVIYSGDAVKWLPPHLNLEVLPPGPLDWLFRREAVTIGATASEIMVAFRGTLPPNFLDFGLSGADWLNDANVELIAVAGQPYRVHRGFWQALDVMWGEVAAQIDVLVAAHPGLPVCFTGHSKGGAMAQMAAVRFNRGGKGLAVDLCTYASARAGDAAFAAAVAGAADQAQRHEFGADVVPHLPPSTGAVAALIGMLPIDIAFLQGYESAGDIYYLPMLAPDPADSDHFLPPAPGAALVRAPANADAASMAAIRAAVIASFPMPPFSLAMILREPWVAVNHAIDPGSGYDRWLFP